MCELEKKDHNSNHCMTTNVEVLAKPTIASPWEARAGMMSAKADRWGIRHEKCLLRLSQNCCGDDETQQQKTTSSNAMIENPIYICHDETTEPHIYIYIYIYIWGHTVGSHYGVLCWCHTMHCTVASVSDCMVIHSQQHPGKADFKFWIPTLRANVIRARIWNQSI